MAPVEGGNVRKYTIFSTELELLPKMISIDSSCIIGRLSQYNSHITLSLQQLCKRLYQAEISLITASFLQ